MKAITIRQPWAQLIAEGIKTIEVRSWQTSHRGIIAIHAGRCVDDVDFDHEFKKSALSATGGVIAIADLHSVTEFSPNHAKRACMPHDFGLFAWHLKNIRPVKFVSVRGMPGLFTIDNSLIQEL